MATLEQAKPEVRVELIQALVARNAAQVGASLRGLLNDSAELVRVEAAKGLGVVATAEDAPALIAYFKSARSAAEATVAERSLGAVCTRNPQTSLQLILPAMADSSRRAAHCTAAHAELDGWGRGARRGPQRVEGHGPSAVGCGAADAGRLAGRRSRSGSAGDRQVPGEPEPSGPGFPGLCSAPPDHAQTKGKIQSLAAAMQTAPRIEEKKLVLAALAESPGPESLQLAADCLNDSGLVEEAAIAVVTIANAKGLNKAAIRLPPLARQGARSDSEPGDSPAGPGSPAKSAIVVVRRKARHRAQGPSVTVANEPHSEQSSAQQDDIS